MGRANDDILLKRWPFVARLYDGVQLSTSMPLSRVDAQALVSRAWQVVHP